MKASKIMPSSSLQKEISYTITKCLITRSRKENNVLLLLLLLLLLPLNIQELHTFIDCACKGREISHGRKIIIIIIIIIIITDCKSSKAVPVTGHGGL
jgi:hypothetical protein